MAADLKSLLMSASFFIICSLKSFFFSSIAMLLIKTALVYGEDYVTWKVV